MPTVRGIVSHQAQIRRHEGPLLVTDIRCGGLAGAQFIPHAYQVHNTLWRKIRAIQAAMLPDFAGNHGGDLDDRPIVATVRSREHIDNWRFTDDLEALTQRRPIDLHCCLHRLPWVVNVDRVVCSSLVRVLGDERHDAVPKRGITASDPDMGKTAILERLTAREKMGIQGRDTP